MEHLAALFAALPEMAQATPFDTILVQSRDLFRDRNLTVGLLLPFATPERGR